MERYRHGQIGIRENVCAACPHHGAKRLCQRSSPFVLERVNNRSQRSLVKADGSGTVQWAAHATAPRASVERNADHPPRGQGVAAQIAQGRCEWQDRVPAGWTDRTEHRTIQCVTADDAARCQEHRQQAVQQRPHPAQIPSAEVRT